ncbi:MAG: hypothetical protein HY819_11715 [Acidobacteria bacterium]|nr:hypothetical protein [Acidobacteriota bacterium]
MKINKTNIYLLSICSFIFFLAHLVYRINQGRVYEILWLCHISNLTLFLAILLHNKRLVSIAVLWLTIGSVCWLVDLFIFKDISISSTIAHIGGLTVALIVISYFKIAKYSWIDAFIFGLFIQQLCRFFTPEKFNVNVAHTIYPGMDKFFSIYWHYWLFNSITMAFCLFLINFILRKILSEN